MGRHVREEGPHIIGYSEGIPHWPGGGADDAWAGGGGGRGAVAPPCWPPASRARESAVHIHARVVHGFSLDQLSPECR